MRQYTVILDADMTRSLAQTIAQTPSGWWIDEEEAACRAFGVSDLLVRDQVALSPTLLATPCLCDTNRGDYTGWLIEEHV